MKVSEWRIAVFCMLVVVLIIIPLGGVTQASSQCGCRICCSNHPATLKTDENIYQYGGDVTFTFSNPEDYEFVFERIYIQRHYSYSIVVPVVETVYENDFTSTIIPGTSWSWTWNQTDNWGNQVKPGRYSLIIETRCCGIFETSFRITEPYSSTCSEYYRPYWSRFYPCSWPFWSCYGPSTACYPTPPYPEAVEPVVKEPIHAVWYVGWDKEEYLQPSVVDDLQQIKTSLCPNYVGLFVITYQDGKTSSDPYRDPGRTASDEALRHVISQIHRMGMGVILLPRLVPDDGTWEGEISPEDVGMWFDHWREIILHYAHLAQDTGVEILLLGSELVTLRDQTDEWKELIAAVRHRYEGKLSYSANFWYDRGGYYQVLEMEQWRLLDYIGMTGYFELTYKKDPSLEDLQAAWHHDLHGQDVVVDLGYLSCQYDKPVVFWDIGYQSKDGTIGHPWDYGAPGEIDEWEQTSAWTAFLHVFESYGWFKGYGIYGEHVGLPKKTKGYTVLGKPAEKVLRKAKECNQ